MINQEAEESVIGAMLLSPRAIEDVQEILSPRDFYYKALGEIYRAAIALHDNSEPVDGITVANWLRERNLLEKVGGEGKIAGLVAIVPAASNAKHYAKMVSDSSARRALHRAGQEIVAAVDRGGNVADLKNIAEELLTGVQHYGFMQKAEPITEGLSELMTEIREAYVGGKPITGTLTGFSSLDDVMLGMWPGQFIVIAGRPGDGKSTLALNIAENLVDRGINALFVSLEMSKRELQFRSLARLSEIDSRILTTGQMSEAQAQKLGVAVPKFAARTGLHIQDDGAVTLPTLRAEATRLVRQENIGVLIVDYIQLMTGEGRERSEQVGSISRGLKLLARKLNIPIIGLSQMNRSIDGRGVKRPQLSDLRESGSLEQDADVVIFLHDEANYDADKVSDGTIKAIIAKNRKGPMDDVTLGFNRSWSRFLELRTISTNTSDKKAGH